MTPSPTRSAAPLDAGRVLTDIQRGLHAGSAGTAIKTQVKKISAQAGLSRDAALPCEPDVARFLKRLGWIAPHSQRKSVAKAYADFIAEAARRQGVDPLAASLYLRIHAGGSAGSVMVEGLAPLCGETPVCSRCPCLSYCAYATRAGETADELNRLKQALEAGRAEELADEDLLAILWKGTGVVPEVVRAARQMLSQDSDPAAADGDQPQMGAGNRGTIPPDELSIAALDAIAKGQPLTELHGSGTGGLRSLFALDPIELRRRVRGDLDDCLRLLAVREIYRRWARGKAHTGRPIMNAKDLFDAFHLLLRDAPREIFYVGLLDNKHRLYMALRISEGTINSAPIHPREVFAPVIRAQATAVAFIHNHPSGDPAPSREDLTVTKRLAQAAEMLGIKVLDHVIIGDGRFYSFAESGKL